MGHEPAFPQPDAEPPHRLRHEADSLDAFPANRDAFWTELASHGVKAYLCGHIHDYSMEQMLTTGGGWQDQIGGLAGGAKYIVTQPGLKPAPIPYQLDPFLFEQSSSCFTLYYTGVTRLAKNILQEVVDRVNSMEPAYLFTLRRLKDLARAAREAISRRNLRELAAVLNASWEANKLIHHSTTNDEIEGMLRSVNGLYSGMKLLAAGGGGFALFISETPERACRLRERLAAIPDDRARLVDVSPNHRGLHVTVS